MPSPPVPGVLASSVVIEPVWTRLAREMVDVAPDLTERLVQLIVDNNPGYAARNVVPLEDLRRSCHDNIVRLLQILALQDVPHDDSAEAVQAYLDAARETGSRRAEQGLPLDDVLRSFRLGGQLIWEALNDQAAADDVMDADVLREVGTRLWAAVDMTSSQVAATYHSTGQGLMRVDEQRRASLWEGLLTGRAKDPTFAHEAARVVGLPTDGRLVVAVVEHADRDSFEARGLARRLEDQLARRDIVSAWQPRAGTTVAVVHLGDRAVGAVQDVLAAMTDAPIGLSLAVAGLAELDVAHRQAVLALRTVAPHERDITVALEDRLPEALLLSSPELTDQLVRRWLGPLLALDAPADRPLLETLTAWVATSGSTSSCAALMHCHRNTVINRVRRLEEVLGYPLSVPVLPVELTLALRAWRLVAAGADVSPAHNTAP